MKIIEFFDEYKGEATGEAFGVAPSTVYLRKQKLRLAGGDLVALPSKSRARKRRSKREASEQVVQFIVQYRTEHPGMGPALSALSAVEGSVVEGKETIKPALDDFCEKNRLQTVSESTVGTVLSDLKKQGRLPTRTRF